MPNLNLRKVPDKVYKKIQNLAKKSKRSINSEINYLLSNAVENETSLSQRKNSFYEEVLKIRTGLKGRRFPDSIKLIREMRDK